jgi:hypothetical protein
MDCVHYWEVGPWGGGGAPTGLIAPGATHPRYATVQWRRSGLKSGGGTNPWRALEILKHDKNLWDNLY